MTFQEFSNKINTHTKLFYQNDIEQVTENGKIINWFIGLAGGGLLFSFNKYSEITEPNLNSILLQAGLFILILVVGIIHRYLTKSYKNRAVHIMRTFDFLNMEFDLVSENELENDMKTEKMDTIFFNYVNGEYFGGNEKKEFEKLNKRQAISYRINLALSILSILLVLVQFSFFFMMIIK